MSREQRLTRQIVVRLDDLLYECLEADARRHGRTVAQSVRRILADALPSYPYRQRQVTVSCGFDHPPGYPCMICSATITRSAP